MPKICPHCEAEIENLKYECDLVQYGYEYGTVDFDGDVIDCEDSEVNDSETSDYRYSCPECDFNINLSDLDNQEEREATEQKPEPIITTESTLEDCAPWRRTGNGLESGIPTAECPNCDKRFEINDEEENCCCPDCNHEFKKESSAP